MANPVKIVKGAAKMVKLGTRSKIDEKIISSTIKKKKPSLKQAQKAKPLANPKSGVKVLPRKSAPKSDLSNRGKKLTRSERSVRAQDYKFDKSLDSYYKGETERAATAPQDYYLYKKNLRGPGKANARKTAALNKEGKPVIKINSQQNLKKKGK